MPVAVNVNPQYTASELEHQLRDSGAAAIVVLEFNAALRNGRSLNLSNVPVSHDDIAFLQYTGGTTGVAKGAVLTHGNLVANLQQVGAWIAHDLIDGEEVFVCPLPLYIIGVNTLYRSLLDAPEFAEVDTRWLKVANAGGMAVQRAVAQRWKTATGVPIIEAYGLTETSPGVTCNPLDIVDWTGTIGMPFPSTVVTILDDSDKPLAVGGVGEICVRGPQVMQSYWNRPEETAKVFTTDGWLRTGDMGFIPTRGRAKPSRYSSSGPIRH